MKPLTFGTTKLGFLKSAFNAEIWRIIFGLWEFRDRAVLALRFITIVVQHTALKAVR